MAIKLNQSKLVKNLVANHKLVTHIDQEIAKDEFPWSFDFKVKERDDGWHPSGDCLESIHDLWLLATELSEPITPPGSSLRKTFAVGHFWHQYLQHIVCERLGFCKPEAIEAHAEERWGEGAFHYVSGSADIAPCHVPGHGDWLVDFKTTNSFSFTQLSENLLQKWEAQVNIYLDLFDMEKAMIVVIQKDSPHALKEVTFTRNQPLIDAIYGKWKLVSACLDAKIEPPVDEETVLPFQGKTG